MTRIRWYTKLDKIQIFVNKGAVTLCRTYNDVSGSSLFRIMRLIGKRHVAEYHGYLEYYL